MTFLDEDPIRVPVVTLLQNPPIIKTDTAGFIDFNYTPQALSDWPCYKAQGAEELYQCVYNSSDTNAFSYDELQVLRTIRYLIDAASTVIKTFKHLEVDRELQLRYLERSLRILEKIQRKCLDQPVKRNKPLPPSAQDFPFTKIQEGKWPSIGYKWTDPHSRHLAPITQQRRSLLILCRDMATCWQRIYSALVTLSRNKPLCLLYIDRLLKALTVVMVSTNDITSTNNT